MLKNVRWRLTLSAVVIALAVWSFYPPGEKINLGLDLKGGVHLVLRVRTDDAVRAETEITVERLRDTLTRSGIQHTKLEMGDPGEFRIEGIADDAALRNATADVETTFDRSSGVGIYTYRMKPNIANPRPNAAVNQAL
jgi:preprotein translocase subunit SecD